MIDPADVRDTIPRLQQLVPHMRDQLVGLKNGATFEQARLRYTTTVDRLVAQGRGRRTASRVRDNDRYWAPTREVLDEAMRLEFVERQPLPSARKHLDTHRCRRYQLTELGKRTANHAKTDIPAFSDELAVAVYHAHPYFQQLIRILTEGVLACPEITEGEVEKSRRSGRGTEHWITYAYEKLVDDDPSERETACIRNAILTVVRRRFGRTPGNQPTNKQIKEALNDAFAEAAVKINGLSIGATDLKILKSWGSQLRILDQSRYVPGFEGQNVIWIAADIYDNSQFSIQRRTVDEHERKVSGAIIDAYRNQARASDSGLSAPYLPIYRVRAEAAFRCKVTRLLVDLVIERLTMERTPNVGVQLWLHLGTTSQPASEPVYRRGGNRRYEMTLQPCASKGA